MPLENLFGSVAEAVGAHISGDHERAQECWGDAAGEAIREAGRKGEKAYKKKAYGKRR